MGTITVRIDDEIERQIDERRREKPKSDFYREIILAYLNTPEKNLTTNVSSVNTDNIEPLKQQNSLLKDQIIELRANNTNHIEALEQQNSQLREQIADLRADKSKLMTLLNQEQALHMQTQKLLPPAPEKKWWQVWK